MDETPRPVFTYPRFLSYAVGQFQRYHYDPWFEPTHSLPSPLGGGDTLRIDPDNVDCLSDLLTPYDRLFHSSYRGGALPEDFQHGICRYCGAALSTSQIMVEDLDQQHYRPIPEFELRHQIAVILRCDKCGWWRLVKHFKTGLCHDFEHTLWYTNYFYEGIIHSFPVGENERAMLALRAQIARKEVDLCNVSPQNLERLVGAVLRDHLNLDVRHVGGPGDGGIDLLITESEEPIAIQVKRRQDGSRSESVSEVRHFLGSMVLEGYRHGILATSAGRFSPSAEEAARRIRERLAIWIELYDYQKLLDLIPPREEQQPWRRLLEPPPADLHAVRQVKQRERRRIDTQRRERALWAESKVRWFFARLRRQVFVPVLRSARLSAIAVLGVTAAILLLGLAAIAVVPVGVALAWRRLSIFVSSGRSS